MSILLDRVDHMRAPVAHRDLIARKVLALTSAEQCDPRLSRIYLTEFHELPDSVKNHPPAAQRAFMATFNNNLRRFGDQVYAMKAASKALQNCVRHLRAEEKKRLRTARFDEGVIDWASKRVVRGPQAQIVVP